MRTLRVATSTLERVAITATGLALFSAASAEIVPGMFAGARVDAYADTRHRLESARRLLLDPAEDSGERFDRLLASVGAGIPGEAPADLGPWLARAREARSSSLAIESVSPGTADDAVVGALRVLAAAEPTRTFSPERMRQLLSWASVGFAALGMFATGRATGRSRRLRERLRDLADAPGRHEDAVLDTIAVSLLARRPRTVASARSEPAKRETVPVAAVSESWAEPSRGVQAARGRLSDFGDLSGGGEA